MGASSPAFGRLQRLRALPRAEQRLLLLCALLLPCLHLGVRLIGLRAWRRLLERSASPAMTPADLSQARRLATLVQAAAVHGWLRANCLSRSLLLEWLLRRRGHPAQLRIGVRRIGAELQAHAWVELDGVALGEDADLASRFAPLPQLPPGRAFKAP